MIRQRKATCCGVTWAAILAYEGSFEKPANQRIVDEQPSYRHNPLSAQARVERANGRLVCRRRSTAPHQGLPQFGFREKPRAVSLQGSFCRPANSEIRVRTNSQTFSRAAQPQFTGNVAFDHADLTNRPGLPGPVNFQSPAACFVAGLSVYELQKADQQVCHPSHVGPMVTVTPAESSATSTINPFAPMLVRASKTSSLLSFSDFFCRSTWA